MNEFKPYRAEKSGTKTQKLDLYVSANKRGQIIFIQRPAGEKKQIYTDNVYRYTNLSAAEVQELKSAITKKKSIAEKNAVKNVREIRSRIYGICLESAAALSKAKAKSKRHRSKVKEANRTAESRQSEVEAQKAYEARRNAEDAEGRNENERLRAEHQKQQEELRKKEEMARVKQQLKGKTEESKRNTKELAALIQQSKLLQKQNKEVPASLLDQLAALGEKSELLTKALNTARNRAQELAIVEKVPRRSANKESEDGSEGKVESEQLELIEA
jgi:hypothetical protein